LAALGVTACAPVRKYSVRLDEPEVRRVQARIRTIEAGPLLFDTDAGHTLRSDNSRIIALSPGGEGLQRPATWEGALGRASGGVELVVIERNRREPDRRLARAGGVTALAGLGVGLTGLVLVAGAAAIAGPANDTRRGAFAGLVTMAIGAGISIVGGTVAIVGMAPSIETGTPSSAQDLGRGRLR
jgi:hypothetical protein